MKAHERSGLHIRASQALLVTSLEGSVVQQLQRMDMLEMENSRAATKCLVHCTHFLTSHHIAHSTNFTKLVHPVVSSDGRELQLFSEYALKNTVYISQGALVDFMEALETWVEESVLKSLQKLLVYWLMSAPIS